MSPEKLDRIVAELREQAPPYAIGRESLRTRVVALLQDQAERRAGVMSGTWQGKVGRCKLVAAEPRGLHRLYVVVTRAVSRLDILHTRPLPAPLGGRGGPARGKRADRAGGGLRGR